MLEFEQIITFLRKKGHRLIPCTTREVDSLEKHFGIKFPKIYKDFLLSMGKSAGDYMLGSDAFYNRILKFKPWAEEFVSMNNLDPFPENAFVFWMHQGYQVAYFKLDEGDDPPVYTYAETEEDFIMPIVVKDLSTFFCQQFCASGFNQWELNT
jgi:hypothetical protein